MPDPKPSSAPTALTTGTAAPTDTGTGSVANGGSGPSGGAQQAPHPAQGAGSKPDGAAPGEPPASGGQGPASSPGAPDGNKPPEKAAAPLELRLPEGWGEDEHLAAFKKLATDKKLDGPTAQALFDLHVAREAANAKLLEKTHAEWAAALKSDKEFGGASFDANIGIARKAVQKFGDESLRAFFEETGLGNHPALVRAFYKIGKAISEDSVAGTNAAAVKTPANDEQAFARTLYTNSPSMFPDGA